LTISFVEFRHHLSVADRHESTPAFAHFRGVLLLMQLFFKTKMGSFRKIRSGPKEVERDRRDFACDSCRRSTIEPASHEEAVRAPWLFAILAFSLLRIELSVRA
jgi:hypothetical protein